MENTPRLYDTLVQVLSQHRQWLDVRHRKTLAWTMVGLIESGLISLTSWAPFVHGRAVFAQSSVRRFARWLANERIDVHKLYGPLIQQALTSWGAHTLYLALDTSLLWEQYCVIRISLIYRGRAIPLVWRVIAHASSSVAYETYRALLDKAAALLPDVREDLANQDIPFSLHVAKRGRNEDPHLTPGSTLRALRGAPVDPIQGFGGCRPDVFIRVVQADIQLPSAILATKHTRGPGGFGSHGRTPWVSKSSQQPLDVFAPRQGSYVRSEHSVEQTHSPTPPSVEPFLARSSVIMVGVDISRSLTESGPSWPTPARGRQRRKLSASPALLLFCLPVAEIALLPQRVRLLPG